MWTAIVDAPRARDWVLWVAVRLSGLTVTPEKLAADMLQEPAVLTAGVIAGFLCLFAGVDIVRALRGPVAERAQDTLALKTEHPRVGHPLEGSVRLATAATPGEVYRVRLTCGRTYRVDAKDRTDITFREEQDVRVVPDAAHWTVPFRFKIPMTAPPSSNEDDGWGWWVECVRANAWIAAPSAIGITIDAPAPEEVHALEAAESPEQKEAIDSIAREMGHESLRPHDRAQLRALSSEQLAQAKTIARLPGKVFKWVLIVFFVAPARRRGRRKS